MKKLTLLLLGIIFTSVAAQAQVYNTGVGIRGGYYNGLTVKHFVSDEKAIEGILTTRWSGFQITGLMEFHNQLVGTDNFQWFYGLGAHIGSYNSKNTPRDHYDKEGTYTTMGVDAIIGLEYAFSEAPISIGLDYKPALNLVGSQYFASDAGALSVRYTF
jgi:hypothetical protein